MSPSPPPSTARDLMSRSVVTAPVSATVGEARAAMLDNGVSALPIVDTQLHAAGIVTKTDLVAAADDQLPVAVLMTSPVSTCTPDTSAWTAAREMRTGGVHHLVVVEDDAVVGMLSVFDLLAFFEEVGRPEST